MAQKLTIGKVAAAAAVNVETIRFYQRRGLLVEPPKSQGGFRYYDEATLAGRHTMQPFASCNSWKNGSPIWSASGRR